MREEYRVVVSVQLVFKMHAEPRVGVGNSARQHGEPGNSCVECNSPIPVIRAVCMTVDTARPVPLYLPETAG